MGIYAATLPGRKKRVLVKEPNQTEAMRRFVTVELLTAEDMQEAIENGESVWKAGTPFPPDEAPAEPGDDEGQQGGDD